MLNPVKRIRDFFRKLFFSSRRRHTRSLRDWSSDVCSSDLLERARRAGLLEQAPTLLVGGRVGIVETGQLGVLRVEGLVRSEERRVGKRVDLGGRRTIKKERTARRCAASRTSTRCLRTRSRS